MGTPALWLVVLALLVVLVVLQVAGQRALAGMGMKPRGAMIALRVVNTLAAIAIVVYAFIRTRG